MLTADGKKRMLAYTAVIDEIRPIEGYDKVEHARVGGWWVIVSKADNFKVGETCVYFEIDSKVPSNDIRFAFLEKRHYKIKTIKMCKVYSQGLIMPIAAFNELKGIVPEHYDMTDILHITYAVEEDNKRKANVNPDAKYIAMKARHKKIFNNEFIKKMMKYKWFREVMFFFFGKKKDKKNTWPSHICAKTDVERIQNMIYVLNDKRPFVATEKVDGSSTTIAVERTKTGRLKHYVCSRNVVFENENSECYYDNNIYFEMYDKYDLKAVITQMLNDLNLDNLAIQFETYGGKIQRRDYSTNEHKMAVFHIVNNGIKFPMDKTIELCEKYDLPHVPVIDDNYILPDTIEELQEFVESAPSAIDGKEKEGIVFYDKETGQQYFKFVSPSFLMKYHG